MNWRDQGRCDRRFLLVAAKPTPRGVSAIFSRLEREIFVRFRRPTGCNFRLGVRPGPGFCFFLKLRLTLYDTFVQL